MRPPAVPLIAVDPYFSVWCMADTLVDNDTRHWTGAAHRLCGRLTVDGRTYRFMGSGEGEAMKQTGFDMDYLSSYYTYACPEMTLSLRFTSPLLLEDLALCSRPVSYLEISATACDGRTHDVTVTVTAEDELCLDKKGQSDTVCETVALGSVRAVKVGNAEQRPLNRSGDDLRIDWGWFWLACDAPEAQASA